VPVYSRAGSVGVVTFIHANEVHRFAVNCESSWTDVAAVLHGFDDFMRSIGRAERAYALETRSWASDEFSLFVCADPQRFKPANVALRLPLGADGRSTADYLSGTA
jgi:hypothetical protein